MMKRALLAFLRRSVAALVLASLACGGVSAAQVAHAQRTFATADEAAKALVQAVRSANGNEIVSVVGPSSRSWLISPDDVANRSEWLLFLTAYDRKNAVVMEGESKAQLVVGDDDWVFPAPIVRKAGKWTFDAAAGREEILNRRIGRDELDTIQTLLAIVDAQREYAMDDANGDGLKDYAARFASTPGKKDGLYWETPEGAVPSPLGPLVAKAVREGYGAQVKERKVEPYHGYIFRMVTAQGPNATDGAYDYMVNGRLFGGFAVIAYPAEYGNSGVKTFMVNHEGVVYEKDLGHETTKRAESIKRFDPDKSWTKSQ